MIDLRGCSFEQWLIFAFDRPVQEPAWWHEIDDEEEILVDATLQLEHARTLFGDPLVLKDRFSAAQIQQGCWFLSFSGSVVPFEFFGEFLWDKGIAIDLRRSVIVAMHDLYAKLFAPFPAETATYMWWDLLASGVQDADLDREEIRRTMIATLTRILQLEARHCREAALHGLNHIATAEERAAIIDPFLDVPMDDKLREYAVQCRAGRAQ